MGSLLLPSPESHWRAESQDSWQLARDKDIHSGLSLEEAYSSLFNPDSSRRAASSFGDYVLVHCIIQHIFFARQLQFPSATASSLAPGVLGRLDSVLKNWQLGWEATKDSSFDPSAHGGPLSFNATGLFRLAYIRLHIDLGPCRQLELRDPGTIARAFSNAPLLERSASVARAVLQCAHSLSIPVRIGVEFVARTQTLTWSIVHSLCNLECGLFLEKWLQTIAAVLKRGESLRDDEQRLLGIITSIVNETELCLQVQYEQDRVQKISQVAAAVIRLWAHTFKGAHVFEIMGLIGAGLDLCADML
ncbi:Fungal-trans domain-containing protein [Fusarium sp. LHS14.1]|nr:Fungal-trans domain-containing protein [Fusarium sp. LHS14.1]